MKKRPRSSDRVSKLKAPKTSRIAALDLVIFRAELVEGTRAMRGTRIKPFDRAPYYR